jgi:hypothetical protein
MWPLAIPLSLHCGRQTDIAHFKLQTRNVAPGRPSQRRLPHDGIHCTNLMCRGACLSARAFDTTAMIKAATTWARPVYLACKAYLTMASTSFMRTISMMRCKFTQKVEPPGLSPTCDINSVASSLSSLHQQ